MAKDDTTLLDSGATPAKGGETAPESDGTVYEGGATVLEGGATVLEGGTTLHEGIAPVSGAAGAPIRKGDSLLDTYRVESSVIEGGMGGVWRVHHTGWNVDLAMKRPQDKCFVTEKDKADFIHECDAWINLGLHPNIVSCYYVRRIGGIPTIFSEWMDGGSLADAIGKGGLYEGSGADQQERILDIAIQFARGLHYAHEAGLVHQDVKPGNLLLTKEGEAKVADFGLAKARAALTVLQGGAGEPAEHTASDKTKFSPAGGCTPAYCSMEQMDGKPLTRRTDIYSWAVSVMEMYRGSRPWASGVVAGLNCRGYFERARTPMPQGMKELLAWCLNAEESGRPHDFAVVEEELRAIYRAETGGAYPRPAPQAAADTADSLNNRALSMLDLGKPEEAESAWEQALGVYAASPDAVFNKSVYAWRAGRIDDIMAESIIRSMAENNPGSMHAQWLLAHFYLERCDYENAEAVLKRLVHPEGESLLRYARLRPRLGGRIWKGDWRDRARIGFSADGTRMLVASSAGVEVRSVESGEPLSSCEFAGKRGGIRCFSPCGKFVLADGGAGLCIWETQTGMRAGEIEESECLLIRAAYVDAQKVFYHKSDGELFHYRFANGRLEKGNTLFLAPSMAAAFSPNGERIALSTEEGELRLYDTASGACEGAIPFKEGTVRASVLFSTDGGALIACGFGWRITLWNLKNGSYETLDRRDAGNVVYYEADSGLALTYSTGNSIVPKLWDMRTGKCIYTLPTALESAAPHPSGAYLLSPEFGVLPLPDKSYTPLLSLSRAVSIRESSEEDERFAAIERAFRERLADQNIAGALDALEGSMALAAYKNSRARRAMNDEAGRYCRATGLRTFTEDYGISPEGQQYDPSFGAAGKLALFRDRLFDPDTGETVRALGAGRHCFSPNGTQLLEQQGKRLTICETQSGKKLYSFELPVKSQSVEAWARYGESGALLCGGNGTLQNECELWVCAPDGSGMTVFPYPYHGFRSVCSLELSADGGLLLSASEPAGAAVLWDVKKGKQARILSRRNPASGRNHKLVGAAFGAGDTVVVMEKQAVALYSRQGKRLALYDGLFVDIRNFCLTADRRHAVITAGARGGKSGAFIVELETGRIVRLLQGECLFARLSPDERHVLTSGIRTLSYWEIETGRCLATLPDSYTDARISPDGSRVLAADEYALKAFRLDRVYSFPGFTDWDEAALPYAERFVALHPAWTEKAFEGFIEELKNRGCGYIRPEGVRAKLEELAAAGRPEKRKFSVFGKKK